MYWPTVSIIILNWNGLEDTIECLKSLEKVTYPNYEVIVVDNGSKGNDVSVLSDRFGGYIHVIQNSRNYGFAEGNNIGIRYALQNFAPDYILFLNNDTVVDPEFLSKLVTVAEGNQNIGMVGPKIYFYDDPARLEFTGGRISFFKGRLYERGFRQPDRKEYDQLHETEVLSGCAIMLPTDVLTKVGLLDPLYFCTLEDADLCVRVRRAGYRLLLVPQAKIWHKGTASTGGYMNPVAYYYYVRNAPRFVFKHGRIHERLIFAAYFFLIYPILVLGYSIVHRRPALFNSFIHGILFHIGHKEYYNLSK